MHAPSGEKSDDPEDSFNEILEQILNNFHKYYMKILGDSNSKLGREIILKPTIGNESLH